MDVPSLLLLLALLIPVALFVARPLFARASTSVSETTQRASALLAERERVLAALQELDFDHVVGKIPEEEYPSRRAALVTEGVAVLKQLDEVEEEGSRKQEAGSRKKEAGSRKKEEEGPRSSAQLER